MPSETPKVYEKHSQTKGLVLAIVDIPLTVDVPVFLQFVGPTLAATLEQIRVLR